MIDLLSLLDIFADDLSGTAKVRKKPKVAHFRPLAAVLEEAVVRQLHAAGHEFSWSREEQLARGKQDGWRLVVQQDAAGRGTIFMDRREELVLLHRAQTQTPRDPHQIH